MTLLKHSPTEWQSDLGRKLEIVRSNNNYHEFPHGSLSAEISQITFTSRKKIGDAGTGTVVLQLTSAAQPTQWTTTTDYLARVTFDDADTRGLLQANDEFLLEYGIELFLTDGTYYQVESGDFTIITDQTHDDDTALYLTETTRLAMDAKLTGVMAGLNVTVMTAAAIATATDIDVATPGVFVATDTIRVLHDDGTFTDVTIDTVTDDNYDFSTSNPGGLDAASAINSIVMEAY